MYNDTVCASATAFLFEHDEVFYLVSNWHVFSGRHAVTKQPLREDAGVPNRIKIFHHDASSPGNRFTEIVELCSSTTAFWFEHPFHGSAVDVGVLPITAPKGPKLFSIQLAIECIDPHEKWGLDIGEQVYVVGYPFGISASNLPIWKAATIASEPEIDADSVPQILIDTATRKGMSGSPVIQYIRRSMAIGTSDALKTGKGICRYRAALIGVYSGRLLPKDAIEAQIGKVWKASCIDEILKQKIPASIF